MLKLFVKANFAASKAITPNDAWGAKAQRIYHQWGVELLHQNPHTVIDAGAGKKWAFKTEPKPPELIGLDIDAEEMQSNHSLDQRITVDCCVSIPVEPGSADLVMARAVVEHFHDTESFCLLAFKALKPGGVLLATFPNKLAPFAIINRLVPNRVATFLLHHLFPGYDGVVGFKAHYNRCSPREFRESLTKAGFVVEREYASYFSSMYFAGFLPIYILSLGTDCIRQLIGAKAISSHLAYLARKP